MAQANYKAIRRVENNRLVYYMHHADMSFWTQHWQKHFSPDSYQGAGRGILGAFEEIFPRWLSHKGRILEAGCGLGYMVLALHVRGYNVEGVEWSKATVELVQKWRPDLPIRVGDVTHLDVPDGYYACYISLGVVEHRRKGPEPFLLEAWRVLKPGGIALVSVPWFNPLRRLKSRLGWYQANGKELEFYQYAFTEKEFTRIMKNCGFDILEVASYDPLKGLKDEVFLFRQLLKRRFIGQHLNRLLRAFFNYIPWIAKPLGHMLLVVARKPINLTKDHVN